MTILLYRPSLDRLSGAGQLMLMQAEGLEAVGARVELGCARGALKFRLRTGRAARRLTPDAAARRAAQGDLIVDHGPAISSASLVFVHNCFSEAARHLPRADWALAARQEQHYFSRLNPAVPVVANSALVARALVERLGLEAERIEVMHPGFDETRFRADDRERLRREARTSLRIADDARVIGFVTSGDFAKRGLDVFLAMAERLRAADPTLRFLVVGSKRLPAAVASHPLVRSEGLLHRPKGAAPERLMAALDVFLYPAHFEEFGMVVLEALALGLPVITSRRVGAAECLPEVYEPWLVEAPEVDALASRARALLDDARARGALVAAGLRAAASRGRAAYVERTVATILDQKRRLK